MSAHVSSPPPGGAPTFDAGELVSVVQGVGGQGALAAVAGFVDREGVGGLLPSRFRIQRFVGGGLSAGAAALANVVRQQDPDGAVMAAVKARAWKELAILTAEAGASGAGEALAEAVDAYRRQRRGQPEARIRSGLNMIGLATLAGRFDLPVPDGMDLPGLAKSILDEINTTPPAARGTQFHAARAQALVALNDMDGAQSELGRIVQDRDTPVDMLCALTRQLQGVWRLAEDSAQGAGIIRSLKAALLTRDFDAATLSAEDVRTMAREAPPPDDQLQAILGPDGPTSYRKMQLGMASAQSVGVVRFVGTAERFASAFLVRGGDIVPDLGDETCLLTNAHVVSDHPCDGGQAPGDVEVVFEAAERDRAYGFREVARSWRRCHLDAALLRFGADAPALRPLPLAAKLPLSDGSQRVYVIGYPRGGELAFSMQNNTLIDHEGPPRGTPVDATVRKVHYLAPVEKGSSGSPVFNGHNWGVIALHHAGGGEMPRLNGLTGTWPANEGIWIQSIRAAGGAA